MLVHFLFSIIQQSCLKPQSFLIAPSIEGAIFLQQLSIYIGAMWLADNKLIQLYLFIRFAYFFWSVDLATHGLCKIQGMSWQNVFFLTPTMRTF